MLDFYEYKKLIRGNIDFKEMAMKSPNVYLYWINLEKNLLSSISHCKPDSFWNVVQILLEADSKFVIIKDLLSGEFLEQEIIDIANSDFYSLTKELCGYNLNQKPHSSIIFLEHNIGQI